MISRPGEQQIDFIFQTALRARQGLGPRMRRLFAAASKHQKRQTPTLNGLEDGRWHGREDFIRILMEMPGGSVPGRD